MASAEGNRQTDGSQRGMARVGVESEESKGPVGSKTPTASNDAVQAAFCLIQQGIPVSKKSRE